MRGKSNVKPINLVSLINAKRKLEPIVFKSYKEHFDIKIKEDELEDIDSLVYELLSIFESVRIVEGFYVGYKINQINREFDLLRFGENNIINIELKRENTGDRMKKQLLRNKYYLGFLGKEILQFTYVSSERKIYYLNEQEDFAEVEILFLVEQLKQQVLIEIENIHIYFEPSKYLVSPFNSTETFLESEYFLNEHQENIKNDILSSGAETGPCYIAIEGYAGTGKTLLTYDIAKAYIDKSKRVLIIHCGTLNDGQKKLIQNYNWEIAHIKEYEKYNVNEYELIIIDETQRIYTQQLEELIMEINKTNAKCIFSYDPNQCLASWEVERNIPGFLKEKISPKQYRLTEKIRINKELAAFIKNLFDLSKRSPEQNYSNISVQYFAEDSRVSNYINVLTNKGWKAINYTPGYRKRYPYQEYQNWNDESAHEVIGQEFDNVVVVMDSNFLYDEKNRLISRNYYYDNTKMLFQMVTRARKKLHIIIIDNEEVLEKCLSILQSKKSS
nr:DNA/RNA helicase domain-containing protein [Bacillus clarus]